MIDEKELEKKFTAAAAADKDSARRTWVRAISILHDLQTEQKAEANDGGWNPIEFPPDHSMLAMFSAEELEYPVVGMFTVYEDGNGEVLMNASKDKELTINGWQPLPKCWKSKTMKS